jgi:hypothetical protein
MVMTLFIERLVQAVNKVTPTGIVFFALVVVLIAVLKM